jgi:hypothetical protein
MQFGLADTMRASGLLILVGLAGPPLLQAQADSGRRSLDPATVRLELLAHERAVRWSRSAPVIHCGPAPLTERPASSAEFARPAVLPLEDSFLDAAAARGGGLSGISPATGAGRSGTS